jgi:hypothetical protein
MPDHRLVTTMVTHASKSVGVRRCVRCVCIGVRLTPCACTVVCVCVRVVCVCVCGACVRNDGGLDAPLTSKTSQRTAEEL